MTDDRTGPDSPRHAKPASDPLLPVRQALSGLRFGAVQLTVHEGRLVQIDVTEKRRLAV